MKGDYDLGGGVVGDGVGDVGDGVVVDGVGDVGMWELALTVGRFRWRFRR